MRRRTIIFGAIATSLTIARRAAAWTLISQAEADRDSAAPHVAQPFVALDSHLARRRGLADRALGAPLIQVVQPDVTRPITPPVTIRLRFVPQGNSIIEIHSFRATFGWLAIDITDRIL